ncbi:hypothetical protein [Streptomyces antarcticus]|uniref:hypothetical protein n=1 Tax=Streptomyces antarcticus TaxID=2996458 RepID=UPI002D1E3844|nr:hypothetical protein [Streptomyces sp. H34-AA3]
MSSASAISTPGCASWKSPSTPTTSNPSTTALGHPRRVPEDRLRLLLDAVTPRGLRFFGVDLAGIRLCADDLDWSLGEGDPVYGDAQDLLSVLFGRRLPRGRLHGGPEGSRVPPTLVV